MNCPANPVGIGPMLRKFKKPLRPKTTQISPNKSRAIRVTIFISRFLFDGFKNPCQFQSHAPSVALSCLGKFSPAQVETGSVPDLPPCLREQCDRTNPNPDKYGLPGK